MAHRIRARYVGGKLEPLEPLDLEEGCEVLFDADAVEVREGSPANSILSILAEVHRKHPEAFRDGPHDGAKHKKHYLYGHPKEAE